MTDDLRICFVGDSFVAGVGDPSHLGWVGRLAATTHRPGRSLTTYNLGIRRDTSADVAARWHAECAARLPPDAQCRVVFSFGVNDATLEDDGRPRVAPEQTRDHLETILDGAARTGWASLVVGPPPVADPAHNERTAVLDHLIAEVCAERAVAHVPVLSALSTDRTWRSEVAAGDGAHPGGAGYDALAALVQPSWRAWIG